MPFISKLLFLGPIIFTFFGMHALKFKHPPHYLKVKASKKAVSLWNNDLNTHTHTHIYKYAVETKSSKGLNFLDILTSIHRRKKYGF